MTVTRSQRRPIPVSDRRHEDAPQVRDTAIGYLADKIAVGQAGLDPYDAHFLILDANLNEVVWAYRMLETVGTVIVITSTETGRRYTAVVETDARASLGLDGPDAPTMADVALASRAVDKAVAAMEPRPTLSLIEGQVH